MSARFALGLLVVAGCSSSACEIDPKCAGTCDPLTEICTAETPCRFLQNGNPNPFGGSISYSCAPLPERCVEDRTCSCVVCGDDDVGDTQADCASLSFGVDCSDPVDDGPVLFSHGCVE